MAGRRTLNRLGIAVVTVLLVAGVGVVFALSGVYNIAATSPHFAATRWLLDLTRDRSVRAHAGAVTAPPLDDSALIAIGADHYHEMCVECHGAPGVDRGEVGQGLYPRPPHLDHAVKDWNDAQLYWIVKNGMKLTGMPAFGPTHDERELWGIVAFIRRLPDMTPSEYKRVVAAAERGDSGADR